MADRAAVLADLRAHLARVAPMRAAPPARLSTGLPTLDAAVQGWPRPGVAEVTGKPGSGRLRVLLPVLQDLTHDGQRVALVDPVGWLNPPGLSGVILDRVLLVRPGATRALWATEQLLRCGGLPLVVLIDPGPLGRAARKLQLAAEAGDAGLCVLGEAPDPQLPARVRLESLGAGRVRIRKGPARHQGRELDLGACGGTAPPLSLAPPGAR